MPLVGHTLPPVILEAMSEVSDTAATHSKADSASAA
jgi:hypothetical protein